MKAQKLKQPEIRLQNWILLAAPFLGSPSLQTFWQKIRRRDHLKLPSNNLQPWAFLSPRQSRWQHKIRPKFLRSAGSFIVANMTKASCTTEACYPSLFSALISALFSDPAKNHNIVNSLFKVAIYCGSTLMRTILVFGTLLVVPRAAGFWHFPQRAACCWRPCFFLHVLAPSLLSLNNFRACVALLLAGCAIPFLALRYPRV